ncbi:hypothetical protein BVH03_18605 [Pseudomonas sp. PA15(2017)]|uniref:hypothetical protein n=1 Tax=Pseudomonas sp. PA15(2017) TaxID=1932111 RepID=UPI000964D83E|nr:hypothetical protein [Pseudomonas sp. PA15(2017)]OLU25639.1 hypothetical protein BVH03_18605 [Pseudomonas sp. PA15(2017)]
MGVAHPACRWPLVSLRSLPWPKPSPPACTVCQFGKGSAYDLHDTQFHAKLSLFVLALMVRGHGTLG